MDKTTDATFSPAVNAAFEIFRDTMNAAHDAAPGQGINQRVGLSAVVKSVQTIDRMKMLDACYRARFSFGSDEIARIFEVFRALGFSFTGDALPGDGVNEKELT